MIKIDVHSLIQYDLNFLGIWINGEDRDQAFQVKGLPQLGTAPVVETQAGATELREQFAEEQVHDFIVVVKPLTVR